MSRTLVTLFVLAVATLVPDLARPVNADPAAMLDAVAVTPQQDDFLICTHRGGAASAIGLDMSYTGVKPLRAYAVSVQFRDRDSGEQRSQVSLYGGEVIHDKDTWHVPVCDVGSNPDLATVRAQADMMAFVDGTYSGPIMLRQSQHLVGSLEAMDYAQGTNPKLTQVFASLTSGPDAGNLVPLNDPSLPVSVDAKIDQDSSNIPILIIGARNTGAVPILGLEFKISYFDHVTGNFQRSVTTKAVCALDGKLASMAPGARWLVGGREIPIAADGAPDDYVITVDAVALADGSLLGARKSLEADELRGIIEGLQLATQRAKL